MLTIIQIMKHFIRTIFSLDFFCSIQISPDKKRIVRKVFGGVQIMTSQS